MQENIVLVIFILINLPLSIAVFNNNPKSWTNRLFSLLIICLTSYLVINSQVYILPTYEMRLFFARFIMANGAILNLLVFLFLTVFPHRELNVKKWILYGIITLTFIIFLIAFTSGIITNIQISNANIVTPEPGPLMPLFGLHTLGLIVAGLVSIILKFRKSKKDDRTRIIYVFLAFFVLFFLILLFNFILPVIFKNGIFVQLLPIYIAAFLALVSYAIIRHRLLAIRTLVARSVVYTLFVFFVAIIYVVLLFVVGNQLLPGMFSQSSILVSIIMTLVVAYSYPKLTKKLELLTDKIFYKDKYDIGEVLNKLTRIMASTLELKNLLDKLSDTILKNIKVNKVAFVVITDDKSHMVGGDAIKLEFEEIEYMIGKKHPVVLEDARDERLSSLMDRNNIDYMIPLFTKDSGKLGILLLGHKNSGEIFNQDDLSFLNVFGQQASIAIENALAYTQIQKFSEELKEKVKQATEKLEETNQKLKLLDKRKDEFISVAAHDLRAPLTAVKGYLSMIAEGDAGKITKTMEEYVKGALEGAEREIRLVNNMLNVSRIEENRLVFQMGEVNLANVIRDGFAEFETVAKTKGLQFQLFIPKDIQDKIYVDRDRIHEVVSNFISNAIKYTDEGSVKVELRNKDKIIICSFQDSGRGMTDQEQKKLFTKFYRAESSSGTVLGTGLGLYIAKLLVEKFGGTIGVGSKQGQGSTFWFELPLSNKDIKQ